MKKFITLCLICMTSMFFCVSYAGLSGEYGSKFGGSQSDVETLTSSLQFMSTLSGMLQSSSPNGTADMQKGLESSKEYRFFVKLQTCSPIKTDSGSVIYGKTKDGRCHFSYKEQQKTIHCVAPTQVALGYSSTWLDLMDYTFINPNPELVSERTNQFIEISDVLNDYCKIK